MPTPPKKIQADPPRPKPNFTYAFEDIFQLKAYLIHAFAPTVIQIRDDDSTDEHQDLVLMNNL